LRLLSGLRPVARQRPGPYLRLHVAGAVSPAPRLLPSQTAPLPPPRAVLSQGYVACTNCRGTGYRATWLQENPAS
jgi:hypothetical protein